MAKVTEERIRQAIAMGLVRLQAKRRDTANDVVLAPHQIPPDDIDWTLWLMEGGRGAGKTLAGARYCRDYLRALGRHARVYVGAPTRDDARDVCAEGPSGLITIARNEFEWHRSDRQAFHKDGGYVRFLGSEEPDRWNGPGFGLLWADELALWNRAAWDMAQFGLRETDWPRAVVTTTPKRSKLIKDLKKLPGTIAVHATTYDNPGLPERRIEALHEMFGKDSRIARLEMLAEEPPEVEGALWDYNWIEDTRRLHATPEEMQQIVVAIDPAGSQKKSSDLTGICVAGISWDGEYYVFHAEGERYSPNAWAKRAIRLWSQFRADRIVAETNFGGDMVEATLQTVWREGMDDIYMFGSLPYEAVTASRGKTVRADPIASMYEQHAVHHAGIFAELEDQMTSFPIENDRDDILDAAVWALTYLSAPHTAGLLIATGMSGWNPRSRSSRRRISA